MRQPSNFAFSLSAKHKTIDITFINKRYKAKYFKNITDNILQLLNRFFNLFF